MDEASLEEVLRRARRRDPAALSTLVDAYAGRVFGLLFRLTGSRDAAEDLMQETFLRMVRWIEQYVHDGRFEPWLFRIAANLARDRARQNQRRGLPRSLSAEVDDASAGIDLPGRGAEAPDADLMRQEGCERLSAALGRLSEPEREILLLRHYSDLSFREIAALLDVPLGTALARAHRALLRLRAEYDEG